LGNAMSHRPKSQYGDMIDSIQLHILSPNSSNET
jgi:hypothetical protein